MLTSGCCEVRKSRGGSSVAILGKKRARVVAQLPPKVKKRVRVVAQLPPEVRKSRGGSSVAT